MHLSYLSLRLCLAHIELSMHMLLVYNNAISKIQFSKDFLLGDGPTEMWRTKYETILFSDLQPEQ
jgi:hypothetical protein